MVGGDEPRRRAAAAGPWILSDLKTLLETGSALERRRSYGLSSHWILPCETSSRAIVR